MLAPFLLVLLSISVLASKPDQTNTPDTTSTAATAYHPAASILITTLADSAGDGLTRLSGQDQRPDIAHIPNTQDVAHYFTTKYAQFRAINTALLALTKCNPNGTWITSMFDSLDSSQNTTKLHLANQTQSGDWVAFDPVVNRENLSKVFELGDERDTNQVAPDPKFEDPWWPWALIEGVLEAGWAPDGQEYNYSEMMHILTGNETVRIVEPDLEPEALWDNVFSKADITPILFKWNDDWSVAMSTWAFENGSRSLGWADSYADHTKPSHRSIVDGPTGALTSFTEYDYIKNNITEVGHLKDLLALAGRPDLKGSK